jgi:hypothetical protein
MNAIPAYVPCHPKDLPTLPFCLAALRRHPELREVTVVGEESLAPRCESLGVAHLNELELLDPWFPADAPFGDWRWYYAMFLKLSISFLADAPDRYLVCDADNVLLHGFPLVDEGSGAVLHPRMPDHIAQYYSGISELLGQEVPYEGSHNAHFMVFRSSIVRAMLGHFARVSGRAPAEGQEVLRVFLAGLDRKTRSFSEYDAYGYFVRQHAPGEMAWVQRRQLNVLYVDPSEPVLKRLRRHYDYASFHSYRRPENPLARLAGATWLTLRLARDQLGARRPLSRPADD